MNEAEPRSDARHRAEVAERLRRRYPRSRVPKPLATGLVAAGAALGLGWLVWAGSVYATPQVDAQVATYVVTDERSVAVTLTVQRRDPSIPATCRIVAQAIDFETVGEVEVSVPPGRDRLTSLDLKIVTLRRATTALAKGCTSRG